MANPYNHNEADGDPEDAIPLEHTDESAYAWELRHTDREVPHVDQITAAIAEYQVELDDRLSALDHSTVPQPDLTKD